MCAIIRTLSASHGTAGLADVPYCQRRDGPPQLVIRRKHPVITMPVLSRPRHEVGQPVEELKRKEYNRFRDLKKEAEGIEDLASRTTDAQRRYLINKYEKMVAIAKENGSEAAVMINTFGAENNDLNFVRSGVHYAKDMANLQMVLDVIESVPGIHVLNESGNNIRSDLLRLRGTTKRKIPIDKLLSLLLKNYEIRTKNNDSSWNRLK